jgi:ATP-dependent RNA helicase DDX27
MSFVELRIARLVTRALTELGFTRPTAVQSLAIPEVLSGRDVCASAITGSGKSVAFLVPVIHNLLAHRGRPGPKALVMTPTRELAQQLHGVCQSLSKHAAVSSALVIGGQSAKDQAALLCPVPDIVIATPGRIIDQLFNAKTITGDHVQVLVLDEADRLLERGFEAELTALCGRLPAGRQTLLFTATLSDDVHKLIPKILRPDAARVAVDMFGQLSPTLVQQFVKVKDGATRLPILIALCRHMCQSKTLVFLPTKALAHTTALLFNHARIPAAELHADLPQPTRQDSVQRFTNGDVGVLLASDLAARGLDIPDIAFVINYSLPTQIERYIHRVGRTARAGKPGTAISLVGVPHEKQIQRKMAKRAPQGTVVKLTIPHDILAEARDVVAEFQGIVDQELKQEEEEKAKRQQENELRRMKELLDVEEEIPAKSRNEKPKRRK